MFTDTLVLLHATFGSTDHYTTDRCYLEAATEKYGLDVARDMLALQVAGHVDIDAFDARQWAELAPLWADLIVKVEIGARIHAHRNTRD